MYYWTKIGSIKYYFEAVSETFGTPNEQLGLGVSNTECYVPLSGSVCFESGKALVNVHDEFYTLDPLLFPVAESYPVLKDDKHYDTLMNGFGI